MKNLYILIGLVLIGFNTMAQKPEKVLEKDVFAAMDARAQADIDNNMDKAKAAFEKILIKNEGNVMCHFGLSVIYSYDKYTGKDYFEAWTNFKIAYDGQANFSMDDLEVINQYFPKVDLKRRNRPIKKNMEWQRQVVEDKLIKFVREENKIVYANQFLEAFPDSKYYKNVVHIRNYIDYRIAENSNTVEGFDAFIIKYPEASQQEVAVKKRNALAYNKAVSANTLSALTDFTTKYPKAEQVEEAKKLMSIIAFSEITAAPKLEAVEKFMLDFPNSTKMPDAKILKRKLLFDRAKSINTLQAYNEFVALYPEGQMYIDIFNLKANALGQQVLMDFPMENYQYVKGFDNQEFSDYGGDIAARPDGSILVVSNSKQDKESMYDSWLLGLDGKGTMQWNKILGNQFDDQVNELVISGNNEIYVAGITNAIKDSVAGQSWLYKLDASGKNIYNRKLEGSEILALGVYDGGEALVGGYSGGDTLVNPLLTKVNKSGKKLWTRSYSRAGKIYDIKLKGDIAYVAAGNWIFAINAQGYLIWDMFLEEGVLATAVNISGENVLFAGMKGTEAFVKSYNATSAEPVWDLVKELGEGAVSKLKTLADGSVLVAGTFTNKIKVIHVNADGSENKTKEFGTSKGVSLNGITITSDGAAVFSGTLLGDSKDLIVFKLMF